MTRYVKRFSNRSPRIARYAPPTGSYTRRTQAHARLSRIGNAWSPTPPRIKCLSRRALAQNTHPDTGWEMARRRKTKCETERNHTPRRDIF